ncbi:hypothetical protein V5F40_21580 [Xanthobacter sp. DSM 14520]|uniref:hypothetical protein n=1 Tax=Xanthobacter autotrophicus (strain ATCC BAA-1158 / Py2) TaxID=78245 RepID=UPI00372CA932
MSRLLTYSERGELFARIAAWPGVTGLDRLTLFQVAGAARLMEAAQRIIVDVTVDELGRLLGRSHSTVRASISALRAAGLVVRDDGSRTTIDITPCAQLIGFEARPAAALAGDIVLAEEVAIADIPAPTRQLSGGSNTSSKSPNYINNLKYLDSKSSDDEISDTAIADLIREISRPEVQAHLPRASEIRALLLGLDPSASWTLTDLEAAMLRAFAASESGPGISRALVRHGIERFGWALLAHAVYALLQGNQPKGLLISMIRSTRAQPHYSVFCIRKALQAAMSKIEGEAAKQQLDLDARSRVRAADLVHRFVEVARNAPNLDDAERAAILDGPTVHAELRHDGRSERLLLAFPRRNEHSLWKSIADRVLSSFINADLPSVVICEGALAGPRQVRIGGVRSA